MGSVLRAIGIAIATAAVLLGVNAFAFTLYALPSDISPTLRKGDRVMVNRLQRTGFRRGDLIAFSDSGATGMGIVSAGPGDTIRVGGDRYVIPQRCCKTYGCPGCRLYLVTMGGRQRIVHQHTAIGKAYRLYHLPW